MYACSCLPAFETAKAGAGPVRRYPSRDHLRLVPGRSGCGISSGSAAEGDGAVGTGPAEHARDRGAVSAGHWTGAAARRSVAGRRCADRNGGCAVLLRLGRRGGRDMGRSGGAGFHRHPAPGHAGRGGRASVLAVAPGGIGQCFGCADAVAGGGLPLGSTCRRSNCTRRSVLAGRIVQVTPVAAGRMAGAS